MVRTQVAPWRGFRRLDGLWMFCAWLAAATGCQHDASHHVTAELEPPISLALNWFPEAEHGGFIAAQVHGFFEEAGLEVSILPGGPAAPVVQQVASGRVDFAVANADQVLLGREQGAPVVAVMTAMQQSPRCIMVHRATGVSSLRELNHLTLAIGSGKPFAKFLLQQIGDAQLKIVPYQGNVTAFLQQETMAQQAYVFSEPFLARQQGADPVCLMLSDMGFNPYTSLLITNEQMIAQRPEMVRRVVRACVRGWQHYLTAPAETNKTIHAMNPGMSPEALAFGAEAIKPLCQLGDEPSLSLGAMTAERWKQLADQLHAVDLLDDASRYRDAFDLQFLP